MPEVHVAADERSLADSAAADVAATVRRVLAREREFHLVLAGGKTPRPLYERLAALPDATRLPWDRVRVYWGDERFVPPEHPDSNYRMAHESLLSRIAIPADRIHRVPMDVPTVEDAAAAYEALLARRFGALPRFHLVLLGLGEDGHVAALFPGAPALRERARWVVPITDAPKPPPQRVTLTLPVLNNAARVLFYVAGAAKAPIVERILGAREFNLPGVAPVKDPAGEEGAGASARASVPLAGSEPALSTPALGIRAHTGDTVWWLDRAALPG